MKALIVESSHELGALWKQHLERQGIETSHAIGQDDAVELAFRNLAQAGLEVAAQWLDHEVATGAPPPPSSPDW